ncbi:hypothetical protein IW140_000595 [Coemansia sp. RSA 1813]|nr:hypothetical protein EV178_002674 [Coemansia sp. RSA 1646]KAJ2216760.1 hypothetical protein EV179_001050 [Coemansia sp. RSA 487]KAJ2572832.1 hypothetical protein IW140_000595 [Coemansia sp. RSA 1813]
MQTEVPSRAEQELNFLIAHYLSLGPMREAARPLRQALESAPSMLPARYDWLGEAHSRRYDELVREFPHVACDELLGVVQAISSRDSSALLTAGGTVLGRTCKKRPRDITTGALSSKLRRRVYNQNKPLQRQTCLPLSAFASFKKLVRCHGHKFPTFCVLFDRTSRRMITGSDDYLVKIWCTQTGYLINTFKGHREVITDMALNVENTLLASASVDGTVRIWNLKTGEPRAVLVANPHGRTKTITGVKFSPSPRKEIRFLATTCDDGLCRLYRWDSHALTFDTTPIIIDGRPENRYSATCFAFNHTGSRFAIATSTGYVSIYSTIADAGNVSGDSHDSHDWGTPKLITRIAAHDDSITTLVFSQNGDMFLTGSTDGTAKVWKCTGTDLTWTSTTIDIKEPIPSLSDAPVSALNNQQADGFRQQPAAAQPTPPTQPVQQVPEVQNIAEVSLPSHQQQQQQQQQQQRRSSLVAGSTHASETNDAQPQHNTNIDPHIQSEQAISPANVPNSTPSNNSEHIQAPGSTTELVANNGTGTDAPIPVTNNTATTSAPAVKRVETNQVAWVCDSSRVVISSNIGTVAVVDLETGKECWRRRAHSIAEIYVLIPHPTDPRIVISGGYDGRAIMWDVDTGDILHEFRVGEQLFDGSFSEDGLKFVLTSDTGAATLFGLGPSWAYEDANKMPEQMFDNDYTATIMDENHFVADQQTQIPSYLVPHSALMDFDGRVYRIQKGPRFGLGIEVGVSGPKFQREEAARMFALSVELDHAYLDYQAAQAPISEVHSRRRGRRRGATSATEAQPTTIDEVPELELPIIIPMDDDSDDEEYDAGQDEEEEEEEDNMAEYDEERTPGSRSLLASPRSHRRTTLHSAQDSSEAYDSYATSTRGRRSALELLRNRHGSAGNQTPPASPWRSSRRTIVEDDDEDVDVMEVDDDSRYAPSERVATRGRRQNNDRQLSDSDASQGEAPRRGGRRRLRINVLYESETVTSDEDFQPRSAVPAASHTNRTRGRPRRNTAQRSMSATDVSGADHRQTRNRRIAIDSDEDEYNGSIGSQHDRGDGYTAGNGDLDVDIDGLSVSDNEHMSSQNATSRSTRRATRRSTRGSGGAYAGQGQTRHTRSGAGQGRRNAANGYRLRRAGAAARSSDSDEYAISDDEAGDEQEHVEDHALSSVQADLQNGHMRVPRSSETIVFSDNDSSFGSDGIARGLTKRRGRAQQPTQLGNSMAASSSYAPSRNSVYNQYKPTDWILATAPSTVPYRPQIGDIVVYFREGHEDFWNSPLRCKKLNEKLLPYVAIPGLPVAAYGKVVGLRYAVGPPTFCTVKIQMLQNQTIEEMDAEHSSDHELTRKNIQVQYHDCEGVPDFIILYSRYRASLRSPLKSGDSVSVLFDEDQAHKATITGFRDIKSTSRQTNVTRLIARNPWKCITVEWAGADSESGLGVDGESKTEQVSPWELVHDDDTADAEIPDTIKQSLLEIVGSLRSDVQFAWFVRNVDYVSEYPDYLLNIAYPMCLNTVYYRLSKGFYRHLSAVSFDMSLIQDNADTFNDPGTPVPISAQQLMSKYAQLLDQALENGSVAEADSDDSDAGIQLRRLPSNSSQQYDEQQSSPPPLRQSRQTRTLRRSHSGRHESVSIKSEESDDDGPQLRTRKRKTQTSNNTTSRKRRASRRISSNGNQRSSRPTRSTRQRRRSGLDSDESGESDFLDSAESSDDAAEAAGAAQPEARDSEDDGVDEDNYNDDDDGDDDDGDEDYM